MIKFEIFKATNGQFYFRIKSSNGQIIAQSEGYTRKESAKDTIDTIKKYAATATVSDLTLG